MKRANLEEPSNSSSTKRPAKDTQASLEEHQPAATTSGEGSGSQAPLFDAEAHIRRRQEGLEERMRRGLQAAMRSNLHMDLRNRLTAKEQQVFELLLESAKSQEHGSTGNTVIRVAGGWVRDKLLGLQNHDIDVALDDVSGLAFAQVVNAQLKAKGEQTRTIGVIQANPQQSKHLETATVKVLDMPIDFVNLRTESYAQDSRIPEVLVTLQVDMPNVLQLFERYDFQLIYVSLTTLKALLKSHVTQCRTSRTRCLSKLALLSCLLLLCVRDSAASWK
eukprot:TRINITY_DN10929_c0_g1_i5.p1 TRINITY_DN10929_c0_g1~~TRINITY_DN10929_c0_g1_i5.p1  ORF type:complete len:277 (-),score=66.97 TRINITY_DN10929_c0_g1_i5:408-1238(-)